MQNLNNWLTIQDQIKNENGTSANLILLIEEQLEAFCKFSELEIEAFSKLNLKKL